MTLYDRDGKEFPINEWTSTDDPASQLPRVLGAMRADVARLLALADALTVSGHRREAERLGHLYDALNERIDELAYLGQQQPDVGDEAGATSNGPEVR